MRRARPVPPEKRHLQLDCAEIVSREPARFGTVTTSGEGNPIQVKLRRVPTVLTASKKEFIFFCERTGRTSKAKYQDIRQMDMYRCPLTSCGRTIINNRMLPNSINIHFREHHNATPTEYVIHYFHKGHENVAKHPEQRQEEETDARKQKRKNRSDNKRDQDITESGVRPRRIRLREGTLETGRGVGPQRSIPAPFSASACTRRQLDAEVGETGRLQPPPTQSLQDTNTENTRENPQNAHKKTRENALHTQSRRAKTRHKHENAKRARIWIIHMKFCASTSPRLVFQKKLPSCKVGFRVGVRPKAKMTLFT